jgi:putative ABC transport system ATP-binding protein
MDNSVLIRLQNIHRIYRIGSDMVHALRGINLQVSRNEYVAIMGHSGSGKSTLMNVIGCLDRADTGAYEIQGIRTSDMNGASLARIRNRLIGFVFQSYELLPRMNALKNVELPLIYSNVGFAARRRLAKEALTRVGLGERMHHRPNQLSGGEKQRVAVARALVAGPSILLADEPTGNLDTQTSSGIMELFEQLHQQGQTIIIVTHEPDIACHARRIVRMRDGQITSDLPVRQDPAWIQIHSSADEPQKGGL